MQRNAVVHSKHPREGTGGGISKIFSEVEPRNDGKCTQGTLRTFLASRRTVTRMSTAWQRLYGPPSHGRGIEKVSDGRAKSYRKSFQYGYGWVF